MAQHKIFVSWSRPIASQIAPILRNFFQDVLGFDEIFLSQKIDSGRRWSDEIASALENCDAGVIVVTSENKGAPWLNFEAGAISKDVANANVVPLLWDVQVGDLADSPMNQFQSKDFSRDEILATVLSFARIFDIQEDGVNRRFSALWPKFESALAEVSSSPKGPDNAPNIADVYSLIQRMNSRLNSLEETLKALDRDITIDRLSRRRPKRATLNALADAAAHASNSESIFERNMSPLVDASPDELRGILERWAEDHSKKSDETIEGPADENS